MTILSSMRARTHINGVHRAWAGCLASPGRIFPQNLINTEHRGRVSFKPTILPTPLLSMTFDPKQGVKATYGKDQYSLFDQGGFRPFTYASNVYNELAALTNRAQKHTPVPDADEVQRFIKWVKVNFRELFPGFRWHWPASDESYLRNSNASPSVKAAVRRAMDRLHARGIFHDSVLNRVQLYKWTTRKAFIKMENNCYVCPEGVENKPPRLIQGAQPEFIALVGPTFMTIQAEVKRVWGGDFPIKFTSGVSARDCAQHVNVPAWLVFENDVSSWDASMCEGLGELECWLAKQFGAGRAVLDLMKANINTHGVTTHGCVYSIRGTRKSGDPYTSVFNSIINGLMHVYCICRGRRAAAEPLGDRQVNASIPRSLPVLVSIIGVSEALRIVRMLVQGDDNLLVHHPNYRPDFSLLLKLGFKADNIYRKHLMLAEFCSCYMYRLKDGALSFGPKLGRVLLKFLNFVRPPLHLDPLGMARGVALGFTGASMFVPGMRAVIDRILELTSGHEAILPKDEEYRMVFAKEEGDHAENRYWSGLRYGDIHRSDSFFSKFWKSVKFNDRVDVQCHEFLFCRETAGPQTVVVSGLDGSMLV
jgi:hypothetical protein